MNDTLKGKLFIVKIVSAVDDADQAFKDEVEGKYINSMCYVPGGFIYHDSVEDAVFEEVSYKHYSRNFEEQRWNLISPMRRKHMYGFKDIVFIEVEVTTTTIIQD